MREIRVKEGVVLSTLHFWTSAPLRIIRAADESFPEGFPLWLTRGCEQVKGGAPKSSHLIFEALDFRTKHLPPKINRQEIADKMQEKLGPKYYVYFKTVVSYRKYWTWIEWIHAGTRT